MLVDYKIGDIVTVKLVSGEEIVGKMIERTIDSIHLAKPLMAAVSNVGGQMGIVMMPVMASASPDATIQVPFAGMTIRPVKTVDEVKARYIQLTTGLVVPTTASATSLFTA